MFAECVLHTLEIRHKEVAFLLLEPLEERVEWKNLCACALFDEAEEVAVLILQFFELETVLLSEMLDKQSAK